MEYFRRETVDDIVIEKVNLTNITLIEAKVFWERLQSDIHSGYLKIIIDLSICSMIDSTFIQILVNIHRIISQRNGEMRIVLPSAQSTEFSKVAGLSGLIRVFNSLEIAINNFKSDTTVKPGVVFRSNTN